MAGVPKLESADLARLAAGAVGLGAAGGLATLAGARLEAGAFILRRAEVPVLEPGQAPIRVLHISDLHLSPGDRRRIEWTRGLAALEPDLVVNTGDNLAHVDAVPAAVEALEPLLDVPGVFVFGSNDYFAPRPKNPLAYFAGPSKIHGRARRLPWGDLADRFASRGWLNLNNRRETLEVVGQPFRLVGMDDPHIRREKMPAPDGAGRRGELRLGVVHAPYLRALRALSGDGSDLLMAGHTHGGQIRLPWTALVTNCDLPVRYARGLHRWDDERQEAPAPAGASSSVAARPDPWLHVSAGLGTSPYARIRLFCRPEATLLTLRPRV